MPAPYRQAPLLVLQAENPISHEPLTPAAPDYGLPPDTAAPAADTVLTISEAAHLMRVSTRTLERLAETGKPGPHPIDRPTYRLLGL